MNKLKELVIKTNVIIMIRTVFKLINPSTHNTPWINAFITKITYRDLYNHDNHDLVTHEFRFNVGRCLN